MRGYEQVGEKYIEIKSYNNQRVLTFGDIDKIYGQRGKTTRGCYTPIRKLFLCGVDYFYVDEAEALEKFNTKRKKGLMLLTETGFSFLTQMTKNLHSNEIAAEQVIKEYYRKETNGTRAILDACESVVGLIMQSERGEQS